MRAPFAIVLACLLAGCGTDGTMVLTGPSRPSLDPSAVVLYVTPPAHYETIGLVSAKSGTHGGDQGKMQDAVEKLKEEAADAGANGVVIQQTGESTSGTTGVVVQAGDVPMFFSSAHHRETINGIAIYVADSGESSQPAAAPASGAAPTQAHTSEPAIDTDFKSVSAAAETGNPANQYNLGMLYMQGTGTPQNFVAALKWLILAKSGSGIKTDTYLAASTAIEKLEAEMTPTEIAQAQTDASSWFKAHTRS